MGCKKKTVKQQMKYWMVGWGRPIRIKARTARAAVRIWMRGNLERDLMVNHLELYDPFGKHTIVSELMKQPDQRKEFKRWAKQYTVKDIPVKQCR